MKTRLILLLIGIVACSRVRSFETRATYEAPKSGFRMIVDAVGTVPAGEDLGAGMSTIRVCPRAAIGRELRLDLPPYVPGTRTASVHDGASTSTLPWDSRVRAASLTHALASAGYAPDSAELEEAARIIDGVGEGPKATTMRGQAHALTVIAVDFEKPRGPSHCAP